MKKIFLSSLLAALLLIGASAAYAVSGAAPLDSLTHRVDDKSAPAVYFTKDVSAKGILKVYEALGRKAQGNVGIKLTFESPNGPFLMPEMLAPLVKQTGGTFIDSNGLTPPRDQTEGHLKVAAAHGFTAVGPVDVLDAEGTLDLPVNGGKHLKIHRTGSHFANYDSIISVVRFKPHHLRAYGGTLKNLSICLASPSGKCIIHSAGKTDSAYTEPDIEAFIESMADAVKAALDAKKDRWAFVNVISAIDPDDDCSNAVPQGDVGIIASVDPVALDQAAVDITFGSAASKEQREKWEYDHHTRVLEYAENIGAGKRNYRLISVD